MLGLQRTAGNQAVVRALSRSRRLSPGAVVPWQLLQRDDWDFTPSDYAALVKKKQDLRFEADSAWFPKPFQENLCNILAPIGGSPAGYDPSGTEKNLQYADAYEDILQFAFLVDERGVIHVTVGSTGNLSRVTGTPLRR